MNFNELILARESCRNYTGEPVPREALEAIMDAARLAPSACNSQPWSFVVACTPEKVRLAADCIQASGANKFTDKAGAIIIVVEEHAKLSARISDTMDSQTFAQIDLGLATMQLCLAASDLGYGTCILGLFDEDMTKQAFGIPAEKRVRLILSVGKSADAAPRKKSRKSLDEIAQFV